MTISLPPHSSDSFFIDLSADVMASVIFALSSSSVSPLPLTPGISIHRPVYPSSCCSQIIVKLTMSLAMFPMSSPKKLLATPSINRQANRMDCLSILPLYNRFNRGLYTPLVYVIYLRISKFFVFISGRPVLLVADLFHPVDSLPVELFLNGDMSHGGGRHGTMPMLLTRREPDHITWPNFFNRAIPTLY